MKEMETTLHESSHAVSFDAVPPRSLGNGKLYKGLCSNGECYAFWNSEKGYFISLAYNPMKYSLNRSFGFVPKEETNLMNAVNQFNPQQHSQEGCC